MMIREGENSLSECVYVKKVSYFQRITQGKMAGKTPNEYHKITFIIGI